MCVCVRRRSLLCSRPIYPPGTAKTLMVVCAASDSGNLKETCSSLDFGRRCRGVGTRHALTPIATALASTKHLTRHRNGNRDSGTPNKQSKGESLTPPCSTHSSTSHNLHIHIFIPFPMSSAPCLGVSALQINIQVSFRVKPGRHGHSSRNK